MSKMKKIFVVALGVVLSFALVGSAYAMDGASLESQTTEGLYDRNDAFDITLRPGLLYQVDRWRLYTNLSGYESSDSYLIGTSGQLGPGSMAFFYEHQDTEWDYNERETYYREREDQSGLDIGNPDDWPNYDEGGPDGWDYRTADANTWNEKYEDEDNNFYFSYSMDFGAFSLGLSYAPEFSETTQTFGISESAVDQPWQLDNPTSYWSSSWPCSMWFPSGQGNWTEFHEMKDWQGNGNEYDVFDDYTASTSWNGEQDRDTDYHPIYLESQIHTADHWHLLAGIGYADIKVDTDFDGRLKEHVVWRDDIGDGRDVGTWDREINVHGVVGNFGIYDADMDGDRWWLYLEPVYEVNDIVTLRLDVHYATEDGDLDTWDGVSGTLEATYVEKDYEWDDANTFRAFETFDATSTGDYDTDEWAIEPRVYFNYDPVRFSLGVGYHYEQMEWDGVTNCRKTMEWTFDDGDSEDDDTDDWVFNGSWSERETFDGEEEVTTWRFPVAAEFDVTEKLMIRAGAAYYHQRVEFDEKGRLVDRHDERWTWVDGAGDDIGGSPGPYDLYETPEDYTDGDAKPYDRDKEGETYKEEYDETDDWVTYQIGLGYAFTENLQLDLMWERTSYDHVDFDNLFTSITLAF
jgi:hypothetical protein